jgi:uncharacterized protein (TIGR03083 family)
VSLDRARVLRDERNAVLDLCRTLTDAEWASASDCAGWTVKDVIAHMGAAFHGCFTPWLLRVMRTNNIERSNDADVGGRRGWEPARVLREYEGWSGRFLVLVPVTQRPPVRGLRIPLGDIGKYPMGLLASAFTFDHHVHLRHDIALALGRTVPPPDAEHTAAVLEWLLTGLPQMCGSALAWLDRPVALILTGPGGGAWTISPGRGGPLRVEQGRSPVAAAAITGSAADFPIWGTTRRPWRDYGLAIEGDEELAARFLDALNLV